MSTKKLADIFAESICEGLNSKETIEEFCERVNVDLEKIKKSTEENIKQYKEQIELEEKHCSKCYYRKFYEKLREEFRSEDW